MRWLKALGMGSFGLLLTVLGISSMVTAPSRLIGVPFGVFLLLFGLLMLWVAHEPIRPGGPRDASSEVESVAESAGWRPEVRSVLDAHADELAAVTDGPTRGRLLSSWRTAVSERASPYADAVAGARDVRDGVAAAEVDAMMEAFSTGYASRRGWIEHDIARQHAAVIGRKLRDRMRAAGVDFAALPASTGVILDEIVGELVEQGCNWKPRAL